MTSVTTVQEYQYRTLEYAFHFKVKSDQSVVFKVYDIAGQRLHKQNFLLADVKLPKATLSEENVPPLLPLLVQKNLLPKQYLPTAPSKEEPIQSPLSKQSAPVSPSTIIDQDTLLTLQELSLKSQALFSAAELAEQEALRTVTNNPRAIEQLIYSQRQEEQAVGELLLLKQKPKPYKYYQTFYQKLAGVCLATYSIKSGMVDNAQTNAPGYVGKFLDCAAEGIPVAGTGLKVISAIFKLKNMQDNNRAILRLTHFFADLEESLRDIKTMARILAREQEKELSSLKPLGHIQKAYHAVKEWFLADETTDPIVIKAVEDSEKLLSAVLTENLTDTNPEKAVFYLLGRSVKPSATRIEPSITVVSPPISPASAEDLHRLKEQHDKELADLKEQIKQLEAISKKKNPAALDNEVFGPVGEDGQAQLQLTALQNRFEATQNSRGFISHQEFTEMKIRLQTVETTAAVLEEKSNAFDKRMDKVEKQPPKKK